ncbi:hypothetical protein GGE07_006300 [Sinorhizobium terangae]|nr:hypothetical protein [Sinorhizobium terangae]
MLPPTTRPVHKMPHSKRGSLMPTQKFSMPDREVKGARHVGPDCMHYRAHNLSEVPCMVVRGASVLLGCAGRCPKWMASPPDIVHTGCSVITLRLGANKVRQYASHLVVALHQDNGVVRTDKARARPFEIRQNPDGAPAMNRDSAPWPSRSIDTIGNILRRCGGQCRDSRHHVIRADAFAISIVPLYRPSYNVSSECSTEKESAYSSEMLKELACLPQPSPCPPRNCRCFFRS